MGVRSPGLVAVIPLTAGSRARPITFVAPRRVTTNVTLPTSLIGAVTWTNWVQKVGGDVDPDLYARVDGGDV
jgi:hypothetical protein